VADVRERAGSAARPHHLPDPRPYIDNGRLDYVVQKVGGSTQTVSTQHINTRYGFGGAFFGDYTDLAVGSDNKFHALYTDSNDVQT
jgi:hypothetical protein